MTRSKYTTPAGKPVSTKGAPSKLKLKLVELKLKKTKAEAAETNKQHRAKAAAAAASAAAAAAASDEEEEDDEETGKEGGKEEAADDAFAAESSSDEDDDERPPIGDMLQVPGSEAAPAKRKTTNNAKARARKLRRADTRAARELSGIFGSAPVCEAHPSSFRRFMVEFIDTETRPRMSSAAVATFQTALHIAAKTVILPDASEALLVQKNYATEKERNDARLSKTVLERHMESAVRGFLRRVNPTLEPVFDVNLAYVREDAAAKAAKRKEKEKEAARILTMKEDIDTLRAKEAAHAKDKYRMPLSEKERAHLIALTIEYDTIKTRRAVMEVDKLNTRIENARSRIDSIQKTELRKVKEKIVELTEDTIPATIESIKEQELEVHVNGKSRDAWEAQHKDELQAISKTASEKRTQEQKELRKSSRDRKRTLRTCKTELENRIKKLAAQKKQLKVKTKRVETLKAEVPALRESIATELLLKAQETAAVWKRALARSKRVRKQEDEMDEEEDM